MMWWRQCSSLKFYMKRKISILMFTLYFSNIFTVLIVKIRHELSVEMLFTVSTSSVITLNNRRHGMTSSEHYAYQSSGWQTYGTVTWFFSIRRTYILVNKTIYEDKKISCVVCIHYTAEAQLPCTQVSSFICMFHLFMNFRHFQDYSNLVLRIYGTHTLIKVWFFV